jgi:uncharacterized protein YgbK (DUF1537 family)
MTAAEAGKGHGRLGCLADDYTGGTDVASALCRSGLRTLLLFGRPRPDWASAGALLEAAGSPFTVVCPASPEHGRTVYQGHLFVGDRLLSDSSMRHHPLTPMTDPDLVWVVGRQTPHRVGLVPSQVVRQGRTTTAAAFEQLPGQGVRYAVTDAVTDDDLAAIAAACHELPVVTGAAGLVRHLARSARESPACRSEAPRRGSVAERLPGGPALVLAGSSSAATLEQVALARTRFPAFRVDPVASPDLLVRAAETT